jgi:hypothetical protein
MGQHMMSHLNFFPEEINNKFIGNQLLAFEGGTQAQCLFA